MYSYVYGYYWTNVCVVLEFELRKAKDTIKSLRKSLTREAGNYLMATLSH